MKIKMTITMIIDEYKDDNDDGKWQLEVGRNPEWTSVPIQIHGTLMMMMMKFDYADNEDG